MPSVSIAPQSGTDQMRPARRTPPPAHYVPSFIRDPLVDKDVDVCLYERPLPQPLWGWVIRRKPTRALAWPRVSARGGRRAPTIPYHASPPPSVTANAPCATPAIGAPMIGNAAPRHSVSGVRNLVARACQVLRARPGCEAGKTPQPPPFASIVADQGEHLIRTWHPPMRRHLGR